MIDWVPGKGFVEKRPDISKRDPWKELRPAQPTEKCAGKTINDFLEYVVSGSEYKPEDVVAIGIGTTHFVQGSKLHAVYLTPRGLDEMTNPGVLSLPYERLEGALSRGKKQIYELESSLATAVKVTGPDNQRTLINWGGPDGKKRVLAIYSKDMSNKTF